TSRWLATTFYPCQQSPGADAARLAETPENGCAAKRSSKPGAGSTLLTGGTRTCPLQGRSPRTSPRGDVAVVSRVLVSCFPGMFQRPGDVSDTPMSLLSHAAVLLPAPVALAFTLARQFASR